MKRTFAVPQARAMQDLGVPPEQARTQSSSGLDKKKDTTVFRNSVEMKGKCFQLQNQNQIYQVKQVISAKIKLCGWQPIQARASCCHSLSSLQAEDKECCFSRVLHTFYFMVVSIHHQGRAPCWVGWTLRSLFLTQGHYNCHSTELANSET